MLLLSILFSILLLVNFRLHANWKVNTSVAILLNYPICFLAGLAVQPSAFSTIQQLEIRNEWPSLLLGVGFVITFLFSGSSTQKNGMAVTSLASNMSLVIPVLFSLTFLGGFQTASWQSYVGIFLAFAAIYLFSPKVGSVSSQFKAPLVLLGVFLCYGITNSTFNYLNKETAPLLGGTVPFMLLALIGSIAAGIIVLLIQLSTKKIQIDFRSVLAAIPLGIPNFFSFYFLLKALDQAGNNGAILLPIYNIGVIGGTALVAYLIFKENLAKNQLIGLVLGVSAILFLLFS
jgi:drug/metabolite transporter (DMT)-like permease